MHKLTIKLSDKSGYNYDLVNDKNNKIIHSWKRSKMLEKWVDGYVPGNGKNFVKYVDKNGSGKIKVAPNKFVIPFRESKMMKLKDLIKESPDKDLAKNLNYINNDIFRVLVKYDGKVDVDKVVQSWMKGLQANLKKMGIKV
tara:strand:- start:104 stop:526 length:423 start_codon:yes stop_codon:yes gene_type:complete